MMKATLNKYNKTKTQNPERISDSLGVYCYVIGS